VEALLSRTQSFSMQGLASLLLIISAFALPLSSTAKSIALGLALAAILLTPTNRAELGKLLKTSWARAALFLFFVAVIACLWSPASYSERLYVVEKYSKLIYLPILVLGFRDEKTRRMSLDAFLAAMFLTSLIAVLKFHGYLSMLNIDPDHLFRNHIMAGYMLDFAAYIAAYYAFRKQGLKRLGYFFLFLLYSYHVLFINGGRMGYLLYFLSLFLLIIQLFRWRQAVLILLLFSLSSIFIYSHSSFMKERMVLLKTQYQSYQQNMGDNSVGFRLQFHHYAYKLFSKHPYIGNGTSSFLYHFRTDDPVPGWGLHHQLREPHSQYWYTASEFGLLGLMALLAFILSLLIASFQLKTMRPFALAILLSFVLGNLSDSLLLYSGSGYFLILFMALCLGEAPVSKQAL
jgi:O-antigen ligase